MSQKVSDKSTFIKNFRMRLQDLQTWDEEVRQSSEGRLFKHAKGNFGFEPYLNAVN